MVVRRLVLGLRRLRTIDVYLIECFAAEQREAADLHDTEYYITEIIL